MMRINSNPDQNEGMALEIKKHKHMLTAFKFMVYNVVEWQGLTWKTCDKENCILQREQAQQHSFSCIRKHPIFFTLPANSTWIFPFKIETLDQPVTKWKRES